MESIGDCEVRGFKRSGEVYVRVENITVALH